MDAQVLILLRALVGFSIGGLPVAFTLFTEFCPTAGRGAWLVFLQVRPSVTCPSTDGRTWLCRLLHSLAFHLQHIMWLA